MSNKSKIWEIVTRHGQGPLLWFDGKKFTNNEVAGEPRPKLFSFKDGSKEARRLLQHYPILSTKGYHVWLRKFAVRRANPESPAIEEAAKKLEDFSGYPATKIIETTMPAVKVGLVIGELDLIGYRTKRKGIEKNRIVRWGHKFGRPSRPLLAVSKDGKQLLIVGGRYEFTEAGIENR